MNLSSPQVCLTVDVEPDCPPYLDSWRGAEEGAPRLLDLLSAEAVAATFFTTGETARRYPELMKDICDKGHELGCHAMTHKRLSAMDEAAARWEIETSAAILRKYAPVTSFRAPNLDLPPQYLRLLSQAGFTLDSSAARYKFGANHRKVATDIARVPASITSSFLRLPAAIRDPLLKRFKSPIVLFVHPWEFVDFRQTDLRLDCRFRTGAPALQAVREIIRLFKKEGAAFCRMNELVPTTPGAAALLSKPATASGRPDSFAHNVPPLAPINTRP